MPRHVLPARPRERGAVLIIAVALMAIMAILGVTLMTVSKSELQLSSNYRNQQEAFFAVDRAVEYSVSQLTFAESQTDLNTAGNTTHRNRITVGRSGLDTTLPNTVTFVGEGVPPVGSGSDAKYFKARNFVISVTGASPVGAANPARTVVRAQVAKIVAK